MATKLTDSSIKSLKAKRNRYESWDSTCPGFGIRVTPKGAKSFVYLYRFEGLARRMTLGRYPRMSLAQARLAYSKAKADLEEKGVDPGMTVVQARAESRTAPNVAQLADEYIEKWAKPRKKSWKEDVRLLNHDVIPILGRKKAASVTRRDVRLMLDGIIERGSPITANRVLAVTRKMFRFAASRDIVPGNPCEGIEAPAKESSRDRVLSEAEIKQVWRVLDNGQLSMSETVRLALKFMLVTAQRKGEVVNSRWDEFDLESGWWTIPAEKAKNRLPHRVPISQFARDLLEEVREISKESPYLFPGRTADRPIGEDAISKAVRRNETQFDIPHFTPHDLRRTAASHMASGGVQRIVIGKILNHVDRGVTAVYDRHSYDHEKQLALNAWARRVQSIALDVPNEKVIKIK